MSQKVREVDQREKQGVGRKLSGGAEGGRAALPQRSAGGGGGGAGGGAGGRGGAQLGPHRGWVQGSRLSPGPPGSPGRLQTSDSRVP